MPVHSDIHASAAVLLAMAVSVWATASVRAAVPSEEDVKAAYVVNILRLVEPRSPVVANELVLCLLNAGPIEPPLRILEGTVIRGRKLRIRTAAKGDTAGCQVLFFGRSSGFESVVSKANSEGHLTLGNDSEFLSMAGMIALVVENRRVVVVIDRSAIQSGDWRFSSHLLEIARLSSRGSP